MSKQIQNIEVMKKKSFKNLFIHHKITPIVIVVFLSILSIYIFSINSLKNSVVIIDNVKYSKHNLIVDEQELNNSIQQNTYGQFEDLNEEYQKKIIQNTQDQIINRKLLLNQILSENVHKENNFKLALKQEIDKIKEDALFKYYLLKIESTVSLPTQNEIDTAFIDNIDTLTADNEYEAFHILVNDENTAKMIIASLSPFKEQELKSKFIELENIHSLDNNSINGNLGKFKASQVVPEFAHAIFDMNDMTISKSPVKSSFGFHVILMIKNFDFNENLKTKHHDKLVKIVQSKKVKKILDEKLQKLRKDNNI